jgi:hypothetical protein
MEDSKEESNQSLRLFKNVMAFFNTFGKHAAAILQGQKSLTTQEDHQMLVDV